MARKIIGMARKIDPTRSWPRRWRVLLSIAVLVGASFTFVQTVLAVHDAHLIELEGDATTTLTHDWDQVHHDVTTVITPGNPAQSGANAVSWQLDGSGSASIFTGGGSKDGQNINQWAWKNSGGLPDKDNLVHSFAARYSVTGDDDCPTGTAATCEMLYFGSDRFDNSGDAVQGFWFFQNKVSTTWDSDGNGTLNADCPISIGGGTGFCDPDTGDPAVHMNGDMLVISEFSNGGTKSSIAVYQWLSGALTLVSASDAANCATRGALDPYCGIVNPANGTAAAWPFVDKTTVNAVTHPANTYLQGELFEAAVNLSLLGFAERCFASVASESRSSTSVTATLKDFVIGGFGSCDSSLVTTPKDGVGGGIPADGLSIGTGVVAATDSALLTVNGVAVWSGTLKFFLCGPIATGTCASGGLQIGPEAGVTVNNTMSQPFLSSAANITSAGRYCWRGEFAASTAGVPDGEDASDGECFTVNPVQPDISTDASDDVTLGGSISDTALLIGPYASKPGSGGGGVGGVINPTAAGGGVGGTINFKLYGPFALNVTNPVCSTLATGFPAAGYTVNVLAGGATSPSFQPQAAGLYIWVASYSGDLPNTLGTTAACDEAGERVIITQLQPTMITRQRFVPNDRATVTVTAGGNLAGTVRFRLYDNASCNPIGTTLYDKTFNIATQNDGTGTALSRSVLTDNTTEYLTSKSFSWLVEYASTNGAHKNVTSSCNNENSSIMIDNGSESNTP